ncbi:hypothetical protein HA402_010826 [Bradysia odoriphaga]|nr:hypothetical protein HA402_010826 [Bradysia odoriphaga]
MTKAEIESGLKSIDGKNLDPDVIYDQIGGFGKFQFVIYILLCIPLMFILCCNFSYIFIASDMEYRCFVPECDVDHVNDQLEWTARAVPSVDGTLSKCERFMPISVDESVDSVCRWTFNRSDVVTCQDFVFQPHERFLLNEFNLTCESNEWKLSLVGSLANTAECIALPFMGLIADKYGRRPTLIGSIFLVSAVGIAKTFSTNYPTFMILHFIGALFGSGAFGLTFVFGSEAVGRRSRGLGAAIISNVASVAQMFLAVVTMFISDFRVLLRLLYGILAFTLTSIWLVPESVRWLFSIGKYAEGAKILEKVARWNGTKIPVDTLTDLKSKNKSDLLLGTREVIEKDEGQHSLVEALKSPVLRNRLINCSYCFFTNSLIYFGLSVYSSSLPGNKHINLLYAGAIEIPGNIATYYVIQRYGRKWSLIVTMIVCSVACIGSELLSGSVMEIILFLVGKFAIALSYTILSLYAIELFPTNLRQSMFNICLISAGCGNIMAPLLPLSKNFLPSLPLILFGGTSLSSALLVLLLPETLNKRMPDTIEEAVNI